MIKRDIGMEILEGLKAIKKGEARRFKVEVPSDIQNTRRHLKLSQLEFSELMNVSIKTLQDWEQGRRKPSGPACTLLEIAKKHPRILLSYTTQKSSPNVVLLSAKPSYTTQKSKPEVIRVKKARPLLHK